MSDEEISADVHSEAEAQIQEEIDWIGRIGGMLVSPKATLEYVARRPGWLIPCLFLLIWWISTLIILTALRIRMRTPSTPGMFLTWAFPAIAVVGWGMKSGIIWLSGRAFGGRARFYPLFSVIGYAYFPGFLGGMLGYAPILLGRPIVLPTNLGVLLHRMGLLESAGTWDVILNTVASSINIFGLWSLGLTFLGVHLVFKFEARKVTFITFSYWIASLAFSIGRALVMTKLTYRL